jgi:hypothetical protein
MYSGPWNFDATGLGTGPLTGWALCNGNNGTPDLSDRFVLATNTAAQVGTTGGAHTYTLTIAQLPPHTHTISADGTHTHDIYGVFHGQDNEGMTTVQQQEQLGEFSAEMTTSGPVVLILPFILFKRDLREATIMEEPPAPQEAELQSIIDRRLFA